MTEKIKEVLESVKGPWERHIQTILLTIIVLIGGYMARQMDAYAEYGNQIQALSIQFQTMQLSVEGINNRLEGYGAGRQRLDAVERKAQDHEQRIRELERRERQK